MSEPTTEAGREMLDWHGYRRPVTGEWIATIEAEAAAAERAAIRAEVQTYGRDMLVDPSDPDPEDVLSAILAILDRRSTP